MILHAIAGKCQHPRRKGSPSAAAPQSFLSGEGGGTWDATYAKACWQDAARTSAAIPGSLLFAVDDTSPNKNNMVAASTALRPYLHTIRGVNAAHIVGTFGMTATFASSLGSNCTIILAAPGAGIEILQGQTIGTSYTSTIPFSYLAIINRALNASELIAWRAFAYTKSGVAESAMMLHATGISQSLGLGTACNAVVDSANHTSNAYMLNCNSGSDPRSPRAHFDNVNATIDSPIDVAQMPGDLIALHESLNGNGTSGETIWTGFCAQFMSGNTTTAKIAVDAHGRGSATIRPYSGGTPHIGFDLGSFDNAVCAHASNGQVIQNLIRAAAESGGSVYRLYLALLTHGEADANAGTTGPQYQSDVIGLQAGYLAQSRDTSPRLQFPMFISQMSDMQYAGGSAVPWAQADLHNPAGGIWAVGPKYHLSYPSGIHLNAISYRILGEYDGKVARRVMREGVRWMPCRPISATRSGATGQVLFNVPVAPLVVDTTNVSSIANKGATYSDSGGTITLTSFTLNADGVHFDYTLSADPTGNTNKLISFAATQVGLFAGPINGCRTNIRDSDGEVGALSGANLYNWCELNRIALP